MPSAAAQFTLPVATLLEKPESPVYAWSDKKTKTRIWEGRYADCVTAAPEKGTNVAGWWVSSVNLEHLKGDMGRLTVTYEAATGSGAALPPDEFDFESSEIGPRLALHPRFYTLTLAQIQKVETAVSSSDLLGRASSIQAVQDEATGLGSPAGLPLSNYLRLRQKNVDSFYLAGIEYTWVSYAYVLPPLTTGGYIDVPMGPGAPFAPAGYSWLRLSDVFGWQQGRFRIVRKWRGSPPNSVWDAWLYAR
jgi:hypothetical protein